MPCISKYLQRVIAESSIVADCQTLLAGAWKQRNKAGCESYLHNSGPDNELKSTLDITPHPQDIWEQHPIRTTARRFKFEETGNIEGNCLLVNSPQSPSRTFQPEFKFGAYSPSPCFQFGVTVSTSHVAEGTIFNFPAVDESNTEIDTWRGVRAPGAIPSIY